MSAKTSTVPISIYLTLGSDVDQEIFRSGDQSELKPPVLSSQASLVLIYRPTEGMKVSINLAHPGVSASDLWCGSVMHYHLGMGFEIMVLL
ncbi:hypothetical protein TNCV_2996771 [Trichonephila clavipes]|nr:hypothetical protein TNCV_2996771 [Trichonephila clavipes]